MPSILIIGSGPAGLSAAIYAARAGIQTIVAYKDGGALEKTDKIENYFGFVDVISGPELLARGRAQAERLGAQLIQTEVTGVEYAKKGFTVKTTQGTFAVDAVILATGAPRATPPIPGVRELEGRGVSYCAICDAFFYRGKAVAVLGEGEYALEEARTLLPVAASVTLLTSGAPAPNDLPEGLLVDERPVSAVEGEDKVARVTFKSGDPLAVDGVFIAYGTAGSSDFARKLGAQLDGNRIQATQDGATAVPGLFAAGDCTGGLLQVAKAVSDGAQAALSAIKYVRKA
ncbi:NAD(P)/FAD-dependent oxidoreductase [uncultured Agathobaculum sp.]|uniref:NAD(P)/FAD-dependent oxidoreductase n=1 Tax=uncultured Agathobaculum sp. TaxID=2048140 RepID=UPI00320B6EB7